jgi:hypothetical protein
MAAERADFSALQMLVAAKADLNTSNLRCDNKTPARAAAAGNALEEADDDDDRRIRPLQLLMASKVSVNMEDGLGETPVWSAAQAGRAAVVQVLLVAKGAKDHTDHKAAASGCPSPLCTRCWWQRRQ